MSLSSYLSQRGLTHEGFGALIGVTGTTVYRYLKGIRIPEPEVMQKIIIATDGDVTANDFYNLPTHKVTLRPKKTKRS